MQTGLIPDGNVLTSGANGTFRLDPQELFKVTDVHKLLIAEALFEDSPLITRKAKHTMVDITKATKVIEDSTAMFNTAFNAMMAKQVEITEQTKKVGAAVRDAQQKLSDGLDRISKTADFAKLERYVSVLERVAGAMTILAELEKSGHMEKFAKAMK